MFSLVAFSESIDPNGIHTRMAAVPDQTIRTTGDQVTIGEMNMIVGAYATVGTLGDECRLISPSLRRFNPLYITPVELALSPPTHSKMVYHGDNPIPLKTNEALEVENNSNPAAVEQQSVVVWLSDGPQVPVTGDIYTVNLNTTITLLAGEWAFAELDFPDSLPVGQYSVVGARCEVANGVAFRFAPIGSAVRPGGVCAPDVGGIDPYNQRWGRLGNWFEFNTVQPPGVEILSSAAAGAATYDIFIDVIPVAV